MLRRWVLAVVLATATLSGCGLFDTRPDPLARNCAEWSRLDAAERLQTAAAVIEPGLMAAVRERQQLSADTPDDEVLLAVGSSIEKVCELEGRPGLLLAEVVASLYR